MFDEHQEEPGPEAELEEKFQEVFERNQVARYGYESARRFGLSEEMRLKASIIALVELNLRAQRIITDAVMHGMPVTKEVAEVRNAIIQRPASQTTQEGSIL